MTGIVIRIQFSFYLVKCVSVGSWHVYPNLLETIWQTRCSITFNLNTCYYLTLKNSYRLKQGNNVRLNIFPSWFSHFKQQEYENPLVLHYYILHFSSFREWSIYYSSMRTNDGSVTSYVTNLRRSLGGYIVGYYSKDVICYLEFW